MIKSTLFAAQMLAPELSSVLTGTFPFAGNACAALTDRVLAELGS
jgi:hypothetical protein